MLPSLHSNRRSRYQRVPLSEDDGLDGHSDEALSSSRKKLGVFVLLAMGAAGLLSVLLVSTANGPSNEPVLASSHKGSASANGLLWPADAIKCSTDCEDSCASRQIWRKTETHKKSEKKASERISLCCEWSTVAEIGSTCAMTVTDDGDCYCSPPPLIVSPSAAPSLSPSRTYWPPWISFYPRPSQSSSPSPSPSESPSFAPTAQPSAKAMSANLSSQPALSPSLSPSATPSATPLHAQTSAPSHTPSHTPTVSPSHGPTVSPSHSPTTLSPSTVSPTPLSTHTAVPAKTFSPTTLAPANSASPGGGNNNKPINSIAPSKKP